MALTREEILSVLGPSDETILADIIATGATVEELAKARAWIDAEEALVDERHEFPIGKVAELVEILSPQDEELR